MVDINDLWIGDLLLLKKSKRIGKFEGRVGHKKVRVRMGDKTVVTAIGNIELAPEQVTPEPKIIERPKFTKPQKRQFEAVIDLHIEVLNPSMSHSIPERIISYQIDSAKAFIEEAISNNTPKIEIIHGKGEGVLKSEVLHLLSFYESVQFTFDKNQGGSTEVWLR